MRRLGVETPASGDDPARVREMEHNSSDNKRRVEWQGSFLWDGD